MKLMNFHEDFKIYALQKCDEVNIQYHFKKGELEETNMDIITNPYHRRTTKCLLRIIVAP